MKSVIVDDALLVKEGLGDRLTHPELLEALEERGMYVFPSARQSPKLTNHSQRDRRPEHGYAESPSSLVAYHRQQDRRWHPR